MCSAFVSVRVKWCCSSTSKVKNAGKMPAVREPKSKTPAGGQRYENQRQNRQESASRKSVRASWLQDFELAFAIGR
jgi:hypothetical protein